MCWRSGAVLPLGCGRWHYPHVELLVQISGCHQLLGHTHVMLVLSACAQ
jgi:hypothetical protein